jgi:hypothetical protein
MRSLTSEHAIEIRMTHRNRRWEVWIEDGPASGIDEFASRSAATSHAVERALDLLDEGAQAVRVRLVHPNGSVLEEIAEIAPCRIDAVA